MNDGKEIKALAVRNNALNNSIFEYRFTDVQAALQMANAMSKSKLIPDLFKNDAYSVLVVFDLSYRTGKSPMVIMNNLYQVGGKVGFQSVYLIDLINSCGRYEPLRRIETTDSCQVWTNDLRTGERVESSVITMQMAKDNGWTVKRSKDGRTYDSPAWKNMQELMLYYRAVAFFFRMNCPDLMGGYKYTVEELRDMEGNDDVIEAQIVQNENNKKDIVNHASDDKVSSGVSPVSLQERKNKIYRTFFAHYKENNIVKENMWQITGKEHSADWTEGDVTELEKHAIELKTQMSKKSKIAQMVDKVTPVVEPEILSETLPETLPEAETLEDIAEAFTSDEILNPAEMSDEEYNNHIMGVKTDFGDMTLKNKRGKK